jgi:hypothetical protein
VPITFVHNCFFFCECKLRSVGHHQLSTAITVEFLCF